jgi:hypothetical protein
MKYRYFNPDDGETIDDALPVTIKWIVNGETVEQNEFDSVEEAAEYAAEECQPYAEWHSGSRLFAIVDEQNNVVNVDVEIEYTPTFTARVRE